MFVDTVVLAGVGTVLLMVAFFGGWLLHLEGCAQAQAELILPVHWARKAIRATSVALFYLRLARLRSQHLLDINT